MKNVLKIKNPETGEFEPIAAISGADGAPGANGQGVPTGGTVGQVLKKTGSGDYETGWSDSAGDSERLGGVAAAQYALKNGVPAHNLLDNSDFTNPVNQRGQSSYNGITYTIDRWRSWDSNNITTVNDGNISVSVHIVQNIPKNRFKNGSAYTIALCASDGTIYVNSGVYTPDAEDFGDWTHTWVEITDSGDVAIYLRNGTYIWAALYEGAYTADTLPAYVPKGKHVEMLNCNVPLTPHNLLDNSNFRNPVNQRGAAEATMGKYFIDRWKVEPFSSGPSITINSNGLTLLPTTSSTAGIYQTLPDYENRKGKVHTFAICVDNVWECVSFTMGNFGVGYRIHGLDFFSTDSRHILIRNTSSDNPSPITIQHVALYEGAYDASTLPAYQPKGYAAELAECQRYYRRFINSAPAMSISATAIEAEMVLEPPMRVVPTITINSVGHAYTPEGTKSVSGSYSATNTVNKAGYVFYTENIGIGLSCVITGIDGYLSADL